MTTAKKQRLGYVVVDDNGRVGALTLKPSAYTFRPWEVSPVVVADLFDHTGGGLTFGVRAARVVRVVRPTGWLRDRVRFCYDGFRRQRLTRVYHRSHSVGWAAGLALWWSYLGWSRPVVATGPATPGWFALGMARAARVGGVPWGCVYDANRVGRLFHGPFGLTASVVATLVVPVCVDYEEAGVIPAPVGVSTGYHLVRAAFQAVLPVNKPARNAGSPPRVGGLWGATRVRTARSVFQVSPLQRLLEDATD